MKQPVDTPAPSDPLDATNLQVRFPAADDGDDNNAVEAHGLESPDGPAGMHEKQRTAQSTGNTSTCMGATSDGTAMGAAPQHGLHSTQHYLTDLPNGHMDSCAHVQPGVPSQGGQADLLHGHLDSLPRPVLAGILSLLDVRQQLIAACSCRLLHDLVQTECLMRTGVSVVWLGLLLSHLLPSH